MKASSKFFSATRVTVIAMLSALSGVLYILNFPIAAAFPSFLEFNFSDIPVLIGTFALGPLSGALIIVFKILIKLVAVGTSTSFVGELGDLIIGLAFAIPAGLIYKKKRTFKGALIGMAAGAACSVAVAVLVNWLILVPFYIQFFFQGSWEPILGMMRTLFPTCTKENFYNFYLWVSVLPFNLMRCIIAIIVTLPIYKRISKTINGFDEKLERKRGDNEGKVNRVNLGAVIALSVLLVLLVLFALLRFFVF